VIKRKKGRKKSPPSVCVCVCVCVCAYARVCVFVYVTHICRPKFDEESRCIM